MNDDDQIYIYIYTVWFLAGLAVIWISPVVASGGDLGETLNRTLMNAIG